MPYMPVRKTVLKPDLFTFKGFNNSNNYAPGELFDMKNLSSDGFPFTKVRLPREVITTLTSPQALGSTDNKLYYVDGTNFKYDGVTKGTVTAGPKSFAELNGNIMILPDKKYYNYDTGTFGTIATIPDIDYIAVWNNRAWGIKGTNVYASKLGVFNAWTTFDGLDSDSYATDVADRGDFTGIENYQGHLVFHKNDMMYEVYGSKPSNFNIVESDKVGAVNNKSIITVNNTLYYLSNNGVYAYGGGYSDPISLNINTKYVSAVSGTDKRKLYMNVYDGSKYVLYVLDTIKNLWHKEDEIHVIDFARIDNTVYALVSTGEILKFNSETSTEKVAWELITQENDLAMFEKKNITKINIKVKLGLGSEMSVFVKQDSDVFNVVSSHIGDGGYKTISIPVKPGRLDMFQIKISGKGPAEIQHIQTYVQIGSDR